MILPTGINQWLHMESGATVTDDGQGTLTVAYGARVITIPPQFQAQARALLGISSAPAPMPPLSDAALAQLGSERWKPERKGM